MKKVIVLLIGTVIFAFTACSRSSSAPASGAALASGDAEKPVELDLFVDFTWFEVDSWTGIIPEEITRKTGVKLNVTRAVDNSQLGMMIASGNLPDLIFTEPELSRLASENFAWSYNELIEKYAPDWRPDPILITNSKLLNKQGDNNYYFLLTAFSTAEKWRNAAGVGNMPSIGVRQDILDALGNPPLNTLEDFETVLGMVKEKYPDIIPYVACPQANWGNVALRTWHGISNEKFGEEDGKVVYYTNSKNYRTYLQYVNRLYRKGYMIADNYSYTDSDLKAMYQNGLCFAFSLATTGELYSFAEMAKSSDPRAYGREIALLRPDVKYYNTGTGWAGVVITKNCKNPEAAIKFMQYMWTQEGMRLSEWGREGIEWNMGSDGLPEFSDEWMEASRDRKVFYTKYNPHFFISMDQVEEVAGRMAALPADYRAIYRDIAPYIYVCPWIGAATPKADGPEKNILVKLNDMALNSEVKCFLAENDAEFDRYYNELMNNAKTIGVDQLESYMNEQVPKYRAMYQ
ncbi:MAG: extracellular solute-binding protein [Spirochaetaceae bacterium]|jgi:putative aldouronate transport system substrate-binding protein|nr:extracellular solute-binding protein [Spirochaetaceae bacterium]